MSVISTVIGYAARDAEKIESSSCVKISIPVKYKVRDQEKTDWYQIKVWGKQAEYAERIKKGFHVVATGKQTTYQNEKGTTFQIDVYQISFVKPAPKEEAPPQAVRKAPPQAVRKAPPPSDEDVPW